MKAKIGSGLCVALALLSTPCFAQELQWRPAAGALGTPAPASFVTSAPSTSASGLGRPIAAESSAFVVRGQAPDSQPLPVGYPLKQEKGKETKAPPKDEPIKPMPMPLESDFVTPMPKIMKGDAGVPGHSTYMGPAVTESGELVSLGDCGCGCFQESCGCGCDEGCGYRGRIWAGISYLGWSFQRKNVPPLVTVSPVGTARAASGVLGVPTTLTLFDDNNQESLFHSGGRFNFGFWLPRGNWGLEVDYIFLNRQSASATFGSNGDPQFSRPIINSFTGQEASQLVSFPGLVAGTVSVNMFSELWGIEMNARQKLLCGPRFWVDMLYGFRHLDLHEGITISETLNVVNGLGIGVTDQFVTHNIFNGPQIGAQGEYHFLDRFFVGGGVKVAMGNIHNQINIAGSTTFNPPGGPITVANGGVLAVGSNIGTHQSDHFAVVPEANFKIGFDINDHWRIWAGYDFLFISNVARAGDQIDRRVNVTQVPQNAGVAPQLVGVAQPAVLFRTSTFYAQGVSAGLQYRW